MPPIACLTSRAALAAALAGIAATAAFAGEQRTYTGGRFQIDIAGANPGYLRSFAAATAQGEWIEVESWSWGASQGAGNAISPAVGVKATGDRPPACSCRGCCAEARGEKIAAIPFETEVKSPRDVATGQATGKRQHGSVVIRKDSDARPALTVPRPLPQGSVTLKLKAPWAACRAGSTIPLLKLAAADGLYSLENVAVTDCAPDGASLNYKKVKVRGWNPETKEE